MKLLQNGMVVELVNKTRYMYIDTKQLTIPKYCRFPERYKSDTGFLINDGREDPRF